MPDILDNSAAAVSASALSRRLRPETENPRDARCLLHLQRICGTCRHYQGALRPAPGAPGTAFCSALEVTKGCRVNAARCRRWQRKGGANV